MKKVCTEVPWHDSKKWKWGEWYPLPVGYFARDGFKGYIIEGYNIYKLEEPERLKGDIVPAGPDFVTTFSIALGICEQHNQRKMIED